MVCVHILYASLAILYSFLLCSQLFWVPGVALCVDSSTTASQGKMYSVKYPNPYQDNLNCTLTYHFNTTLFPPGTRKWVILDVQAFSMQNGPDYFQVVAQTEAHYYTGSLREKTLQCTLKFNSI